MKYLAPIPKQFVDHNGLPLSDGAVHVYISGDTQYANVYQDADGNELVPNPARLDSNGAWLGFVTAGIPLDYVVEDKDGNVQFEYEKVVAGGGTANVAIEPTLSSGTKIAECWVDGELLELFAPDGAAAELPLRIVGGKITNNGASLTCTGTNAWAEGNSTKSTGQQSHAEGYSTEASANYAHAEGCYSKALQGSSHAEGFNAKANGVAAHAEGYDSEASGNDSHAEGKDTKASGLCSHAEGSTTTASGENSHAEGGATTASGEHSHSEGFSTLASSGYSHAEGAGTKAQATSAHAEGQDTTASGQSSHAEGRSTTASGNYSHASGYGTRATGEGSTAVGKYNDDGTALFVVGNGTANNARIDCFKVDSNGETWVTIGGTLTKVTNVSGGGGASVYGSLQDAISDADSLSVGDIFETNGFRTSGDGGAARYLVSDTGTANGMDIIQLAAGKLAVLENSGIVVPEQFGAYGNDSNDDTAVFDYLFSNANVKSIVLSANKTYKIQFKNWTLVNKSIYGLNKDSSRLSQASTNLNKPLFTLGTNCDVGNMTIICGGGNTIRTGLFHFGNDEGGTFRPFIGTHIHDIHAYCVNNIIAVDISYASNGSYNLKITHCKFDNPGIGVRISNLGDTTHQSYISDFYFEDILVSGPYSYGFEVDKAQTGGMMVSHGLLSQFSVQLQRNESCGFKLTHSDVTLVNPTAFIENTTGIVYSVELDFDKIYPSNLTNGIVSCYGGILEGVIKNKEYLDKVSWKNTDFVEEEKFSDNTTGIRPTSRHLSTTPLSIYHKTAEQTYLAASVTNGTKTLVDDKYGQVIEVAVSDFGQDYTEIDIPVTLPSENFITAEVLLLYTNAFKINDTSGNKFPCLILTDSNGNDVYDVSGISLEGRYGRVTMDIFQTYYGLNACFDITGLNRASTWKLKVKIPTEFSSAVENAKFQLLGLNVYLQYATPPDIRIETIRNEEWYNREPIGVISQNTVAGTGGQWLTFTFTQEKFTRLAFITFTIKDLVLTADEDLTVDIMSGSTTMRSYTMSLKAGTHSFEVSISTGGTSYTPKLVLTSSNRLISGGTYTCYVQGVSY